MSNKRAILTLIGVIFVSAFVATCLAFVFKDKPKITLETVKPQYYPYEFAAIKFTVEDSGAKQWFKSHPPVVSVRKEGQTIQTIGNLTELKLKYNDKDDSWLGLWPPPWNPAEGTYDLSISTIGWPDDLPAPIVKSFNIIRRPLPELNPGFAVLTFESMAMLGSIHFHTPEGNTGDWTSLIDWAEFVGADALWVLGAETTAYNRKLNEDNPWYCRPQSDLVKLADECHKRGLKFGVWAMGYLTGGKKELAPNYKYSWEYANGAVFDGRNSERRRSISIADHKRVDDLKKILNSWASLPEVDFVGIDYIRNALGGYELADEFAREMDIKTPEGWTKLGGKERMLWLAKKKIARKDTDLIDQWQWWRAHKIAGIVHEIRDSLPQGKPLWVFTLSWEKGWQHGQDPVMMQSAGVYVDAVMLYEADKEQYENLIGDWNSYTRRKDVNLIVGDVIDWPLHQRTINPAGPEEFLHRTLEATDKIYSDGPAPGVFLHDLNRALNGRVGPYTSKEWLLSGACAISSLRSRHGKSQVSLDIDLPENIPVHTKINAGIIVHTANPVKIELIAPSGVTVAPQQIIIKPEDVSTGKTKVNFTITVNEHNSARGNRYFICARTDNKGREKTVAMKYFSATRTSAAHLHE